MTAVADISQGTLSPTPWKIINLRAQLNRMEPLTQNEAGNPRSIGLKLSINSMCLGVSAMSSASMLA